MPDLPVALRQAAEADRALLGQLTEQAIRHHRDGCRYPDACAGDDMVVQLAGMPRTDLVGLVCAALVERAGELAGRRRHILDFVHVGDWTLHHGPDCDPGGRCAIGAVVVDQLAKVTLPAGLYEVDVNDLGDRLLIGDRIGD